MCRFTFRGGHSQLLLLQLQKVFKNTTKLFVASGFSEIATRKPRNLNFRADLFQNSLSNRLVFFSMSLQPTDLEL